MKTCFLMLFAAGVIFIFNGCDKDDDNSGPNLVFKFKFDPTQERLNNLGEPAAMPAGHAGQSPKFNGMSAHYVELAPTKWTQVGDGEVLYKSEETSAGGDKAIDFDNEVIVGDGEVFLTVPLKEVATGSYEYIRVSLAYQNYDIDFSAEGYDLTGTIASFVGYNTYIRNFKVKTKTVEVNENKKQGYWAFETHSPNYPLPVATGQAPATTVVNPLHQTSPIPANSCLVTGAFASPLNITGNETEDIEVTISLSTNKSFEWEDVNTNGIYEPETETVVDMGLRGLVPIVN